MFVIVAQMPMFTPLVVDIGDPVARPAAEHAAASHFRTARRGRAGPILSNPHTHGRTRRAMNVEVIPLTQLRECACRPEALRRTLGRAPIRPRNTDSPSLSLL